MVTEQELAGLLKANGWYLNMIRRYKTRYAYAQKRVGKQVKSRYLITENKLDQLTEENVLKRIQ